MTLKIAACDDRFSDREQLCTLVQKLCPDAKLEAFPRGEALLWQLDDGKRFDLYFLDIYMDGISGVDTARNIRSKDDDALIVFVSNSDDFYREAYDLFAFHYLIKPITAGKLSPVLKRAQEQLRHNEEQTILLNCSRQIRSLRLSNILFISSDNHNLIFHAQGGETLEIRGKLDDFIAKLPQAMFLRCHQSYVINLHRCTALTPDGFVIGSEIIPISRKCQKEAIARFSRSLISEFGEVNL